MLNKLSRFIERHLQIGGDSLAFTDHQKQLAITALLVEIAIADNKFSEAETVKLSQLLAQKFSISTEEINELIDLAKTESNHATSLHQFTHMVNSQCSPDDKLKLIKAMWEIAYADGNLDKYEDYMIRKIADLIHVSHSNFIRTKNLVKAGLKL
uniref:tellurite resistance TerB family protein n=1 Tax=Cellvibrio fontiphilus TaxID=1815559 RepID=UPI002B4BC305|nr:TerB family tellurite resistance protein [Cellvibrio fontiphilus]